MAFKKLNLALLMGGRTGEREVSLASGNEVLANLDPNKYKVTVYDPKDDLARLVQDAPTLDLAFIALHGYLGEDGAMQGLLELLDLPYTGSGIYSSALAMDKELAKKCYRQAGFPIAKDMSLSPDDDINLLKPFDFLGSPIVVKPANQGSSLGMTFAENLQQLSKALQEAFKISDKVLLEQFIKGREFTCAVLGNKTLTALPPVEIIIAEGHVFFDYTAKYQTGEALEICPAKLSQTETEKLQSLAILAHQSLLCSGLSRTDFILDQSGEFKILETNTLPGLTKNSLLPKAALAAGLKFSELLDKIIELALEKSNKNII